MCHSAPFRHVADQVEQGLLSNIATLHLITLHRNYVQASLPDWPGRLPLGLTRLVLAPVCVCEKEVDLRVKRCSVFLRVGLPMLRSLRHLAFHHLEEVGDQFLPEVCAIAGALPQLISLHMVRLSVPLLFTVQAFGGRRWEVLSACVDAVVVYTMTVSSDVLQRVQVNCYIRSVPHELCKLSQLQLLNLSENSWLHHDDSIIEQAPMYKVFRHHVLWDMHVACQLHMQHAQWCRRFTYIHRRSSHTVLLWQACRP